MKEEVKEEDLKLGTKVRNRKSGNIGEVQSEVQYCHYFRGIYSDRRTLVRSILILRWIRPGSKYKYVIWSLKNLEIIEPR